MILNDQWLLFSNYADCPVNVKITDLCGLLVHDFVNGCEQ